MKNAYYKDVSCHLKKNDKDPSPRSHSIPTAQLSCGSEVFGEGGVERALPLVPAANFQCSLEEQNRLERVKG